MRKMASFVIGAPAALSRKPRLSKYAIRPLRATTITTPGSWPLSTSCLKAEVSLARRSGEKPTCSGRAEGRGCAQIGAADRTTAAQTTRLSSRFIGYLLTGLYGLEGKGPW